MKKDTGPTQKAESQANLENAKPPQGRAKIMCSGERLHLVGLVGIGYKPACSSPNLGKMGCKTTRADLLRNSISGKEVSKIVSG